MPRIRKNGPDFDSLTTKSSNCSAQIKFCPLWPYPRAFKDLAFMT